MTLASQPEPSGVLRLFRASGEELTVTFEDLGGAKTVKTLKRHLRARHGFPVSIQAFLHGSEILQDAAELSTSMELQLVLLSDSSHGARRDAVAELLDVARDGHLHEVRVVRLLLEAGVDKNATRTDDFSGDTALIHASEHGHVEIVRVLVEFAADLNWGNRHWRHTALMSASESGHSEVVRLLLEAGADKERCNNRGNTALICASLRGHAEIVRLLVDAGADTEFMGDWSKTALVHACQWGHAEVVRLLLNASPAQELRLTSRHYIALIFASDHGHVETVRLLLKAGARKDAHSSQARTALRYARRKGHREVVRLLREARDQVAECSRRKTGLIGGTQRVHG